MHHVVLALAGDGKTVKLARDPDGEVADVDHLLDFAATLFEDLAAFEAYEGGKFLFALAELVAELADEFASFGSRDIPPNAECLYALVDFDFDTCGGIEGERRELGSVNGARYDEFVAEVVTEVRNEAND